MSEKILVREQKMGTRKKVIGLIVFPVIALLSVFGGLIVLEHFVYSVYSNIGTGIAIILMVWWFVPLFLLKRGRKVMVTPLLLVDEWKQEFKDIYNGVNLDVKIGGAMGDIIGDKIVDIISDRAARSKFALCEEGVVLHPFIAGATLFRWNEIRWFKANPQYRYFDIKVGYTGNYSFWTFDNFETAQKILSENISSR